MPQCVYRLKRYALPATACELLGNSLWPAAIEGLEGHAKKTETPSAMNPSFFTSQHLSLEQTDLDTECHMSTQPREIRCFRMASAAVAKDQSSEKRSVKIRTGRLRTNQVNLKAP
jgi:hypothetical protein